jgi:hypothetical protein
MFVTFCLYGEFEGQRLGIQVLYTGSTSTIIEEMGKMKCYYIVPGQGNDVVTPDKHDLELLRSGVMTAKGFALNYEMKLRSQEAYEWMSRVSSEAVHQDIVLVGEDEGVEKSYRIILAEMMTSMFGGQMNFGYKGELK